MRILIISTFFPPLNSIASLRPYSWAKYWSEAGHDVTVLTTKKAEMDAVSLNLPHHGFKIVETAMPEFLNKMKQGQQSQTKGKPSALRRLFDYLRFKKGIFNAARMPDFTDFWAWNAYKTIKEQGPWDLIISTAGPYCVHLIAHQLKKNGLCTRWVADYRDTWSNNYIYPGLFPFNMIERWLERHILAKCDAITTISAPFAETLKNWQPQGRSFSIENGFDPSDLANISRESYFPSDGMFRIVHTGSIYLGKRDPTPLFKAIKSLSQRQGQAFLLDRLEVLFVGPRQANLENLIAEYEVGKWVKMAGFVSREDALRMQRDAQALLFLAWNDPSIDGVLTGKIFEYLYARTPIVAVGSEEMEASQKLILEAQAGQALHTVEAIEVYLADRLRSGKKELLSSNEEVLKRYDRKHLAEKLLEIVSC